MIFSHFPQALLIFLNPQAVTASGWKHSVNFAALHFKYCSCTKNDIISVERPTAMSILSTSRLSSQILRSSEIRKWELLYRLEGERNGMGKLFWWSSRGLAVSQKLFQRYQMVWGKDKKPNTKVFWSLNQKKNNNWILQLTNLCSFSFSYSSESLLPFCKFPRIMSVNFANFAPLLPCYLTHSPSPLLHSRFHKRMIYKKYNVTCRSFIFFLHF